MQQRSRTIFISNFRMLVVLVILGYGLVIGLPGAALAQQVSDENLSDVERALARELKQSENLRQRVDEIGQETALLRAKLVASAKAVQDHEHMIASLEAQLIDLEDAEREKVAHLATRRVQFAKVLMALERLARFPPEAMIAQPGKPTDTVRSALLLRSVIPEIESRAAELGREVDSLARAREQIEVRREALWRETVGLEEEGQKLGALLVQKKLLKQQTDSESRQAELRASKLANEASTLRDLIARIEADKVARALAETKTMLASIVPPSKPDSGDSLDGANFMAGSAQIAALQLSGIGILRGDFIGEMKGELPFPAIGQIVSRYGETNENGMTQRGLEVKTRPGAQVIASFEGTVVFVGDFRGYGQLLIIEHSGGYHSLLAGMTRIDSVIGQQVLTGEPVGVMDSSADENTILYVELRREGQSINPSSWLSSRDTSIQG